MLLKLKKGGVFLKRTFFLLFLFSFFFVFYSHANMPIDIEVNSKKIYSDTMPHIESGTVYAPIRFVSEALNLNCSWDIDLRCAYIEDGKISLRIFPDNNTVYVNGKKKIVKTDIKEGRIMVPIRFISESFSSSVNWDETYYRVIIEKEGVKIPSHLIDHSYNQDEVYWLSKIISAESAGESLKGQIAVGNVVLNRVKSNDFPNTIYTVIFDKAGGVQFEPTINGTIYNPPSHNSIKAAKLALLGENTAGKSLFFLNPSKAQSFWIVNTRPFYKSIGNHDFYL